ncbi:alpha/beta-hydrolase [Mycena olivaceomarginata]|nr:alpha/beta-hydrolase [Mycena olivaceomarginata]
MHTPRHIILSTTIILGLSLDALAQVTNDVPNLFPHAWPGQPKGNFSPEWQNYFEVTDKLPNITGTLPRNFAGNIPVNRAAHPTHYANNTDPWIIWLQGGPGSSGMIALATEFSWNNLADTIWVDQPVGTGFSTSDSTGYIPDEDQTGEDFIGFLSNLVKVFPSLATRPLFLTGESYAGMYIPYITKHIFRNSNPPVNLRKIAIGDGSLGSQATIRHLRILNVIETYPAVIGYDQQVFEFFREQTHLCGFDLNLTYPQSSHFPTLNLVRADSEFGAQARKRNDRPVLWCFLLDELVNYAVNFTFPWTNGEFDVPEPFKNASTFFNNNRTRAALHSPTSKDWIRGFNCPFGSLRDRSRGNQYGDPSVEPIAFLSDLATNASTHNVSMVFYSGNDDALVQHRGTEVIIQNMTFRGTQGFTRKPSTPSFDDDSNFAGIVHQERNLTYLLFDGAGHLIPLWKPAQALVFLHILRSSTTAGTSTIPAATRSAWASFIATATATGSQLPSDSKANSASQRGGSVMASVLAFLHAAEPAGPVFLRMRSMHQPSSNGREPAST